MTIKLNDIQPCPWNPRYITAESVRELAQSIRAQGLINPITLWRSGEGLVCIAGNRRFAALRLIFGDYGKLDTQDMAFTPFVFFTGDEAAARQVTIAENLQRENIGILEEAASVCALLDLGATAETIAAKVGRPVSWVNRRRKLATLAKPWRERAGEIAADALERIAAYPADTQERVAKNCNQSLTRWCELKYYFDRESRDLDAAKFDTANCAACLKRTGVEADLFGIADGKLGGCLDCKCFDKRVKEHEAALIANKVGKSETVKVDYAWQMPRDQDTTAKRDAKHPCAYVFVDGEGEVNVRWGESAKAKKEREEAERQEREAERAAENAERKRERDITDKLDAWKDDADDDGYPRGLAGEIAKCVNTNCEEAACDFVIDAVAEKVTCWHDGAEWASIISAFPAVAKSAGLTREEFDYLVGKYAEEEVENENENENENEEE